MIALVADLLFVPICATIAGFVVWASNRGLSLDDGGLIRHFLFLLAICAAFVLGISRTDAVHMRIDPQYRLQVELEAHPVYSTIKNLSPDDHKVLHDFLVVELAQEAALPEAFLRARALLLQLTNQRSGFSDQKSRLAWARVAVASLRELQGHDPMLCYRYLSSSLEPLDQQALAHAFSADNTQAFQQAIITVYESADRGMRNEWPPDDKPAEWDQVTHEYHVIMEIVAQRFGEAIAKQIAQENFPEPSIALPEKICAAKIVQLEAMLERPQAIASRLVDSVLR